MKQNTVNQRPEREAVGGLVMLGSAREDASAHRLPTFSCLHMRAL